LLIDIRTKKITSRKINWTDKLFEELLRLSCPFVGRKKVFEPITDDPFLLSVFLRRGVDQENPEFKTKMWWNRIKSTF
jgi:hypothetical protein